MDQEERTKNSSREDLTSGPIIPVLIRFCIPIILSNMLHTAYNMVDMIVVGRILGNDALSAVSISSDIMLVISITSNGLASGAQVLVGQYVGAKREEELNKCVGTLLTVFMLMAVATSIILIVIAKPLLTVLNTPSEVWDMTFLYLIITACGLVGSFGYNVAGSILRGMGDSKHPLLFVAVSSIINLVLDIIFVYMLGVAGAAIATVLAQLISFAWIMVYLYRRQERFGFDFSRRYFKPDRNITLQFLKVGLPIGLQNLLVQISTLYVNSYIFAYGVTATSVSGIGNKLGTLGLVFSNSLNRGGAAFVSQNIAAKKHDRISKAYWFIYVAAFGTSIIFSVICGFFREEVFGLFVKDDSVIEMSALYLPVLILKFMGFAARSPNFALINGVGKPRINLMIGILDGVIFRIGLSLLMGNYLGMGLEGYWYGSVIGGFTGFFVGFPYYLSGKWKREKLVINE